MMFRFVLGCLVVVAPLMVGCGTESESTPSFDGPADTGDTAPVLEVDRGRESLSGKWQMVMFVPRPPQGFPGPESVCVFDFQEQGSGKMVAQVLSGVPGAEKPQIMTAELADGHVALKLSIGNMLFDFEGQQQGDWVRGNILVGKLECVPAALIATTSTQVAEPDPLAGENAFKDAAQSAKPSAQFRKYSEQFPSSPLALEALERVLSEAKRTRMSSDEFTKLSDQYLKLARMWGARLEQTGQLNVAMNLAANEYHPKLALQHLNRIEKGMGDTDKSPMRDVVVQAKQRVHALLAVQLLKAEDESQHQKGLEQLVKLLEVDPFNQIILYALADHARKHGQADEAINMLARIVALPMMEQSLVERWTREGLENPLPNETLSKLWTEKHGDKKEMDAFVLAEYSKWIHDFGEQVQPRPPSDSNQVALCELFTGAMCPPCVAADIATGGLETNFARSDVIVVRYHQHIPGPDPLVNADAEARFDYYVGDGQASTPALCLNGQRVQVGGFLEHARNVYQGLCGVLEPVLKRATDIKIAAEAVGQAGQLHLTVQVSGRKSYADTLRLRLLLTEDGIHFQARNGIRVHDMLVRSMPAGVMGVGVKAGKLGFEGDLDLAVLKQELTDYLNAFEKGREYKFEQKPLDLKRLRLVAFVQDDSTRAVLQATVVEVTGSLDIPTAKDAGK
ncbi:MAG: hypothetical protein ABGZ17_08985 [Planctomycetaceae bacterium]